MMKITLLPLAKKKEWKKQVNSLLYFVIYLATDSALRQKKKKKVEVDEFV